MKNETLAQWEARQRKYQQENDEKFKKKIMLPKVKCQMFQTPQTPNVSTTSPVFRVHKV